MRKGHVNRWDLGYFLGPIILTNKTNMVLDNTSNEKRPYKPVGFGILFGTHDFESTLGTFLDNTSNENGPYKPIGFGMIYGATN